MNRFKIVLIIISLVQFSCKSKPIVAGWHDVSDKVGKYSISFPTTEIDRKSEQTLQIGKVKWTEKISFDLNDTTVYFSIKYADLQSSYCSDSTKLVSGIIDLVQADFANKNSVDLGKMYAKSILDYPGKQYKWYWRDKSFILICCSYLVNNRLYLLSVKVKYKDDFDVVIDRFINSFKLIDTQPCSNKSFVVEYPKIDFKIDYPENFKIDSAAIIDPYFGIITSISSSIERADFKNGNKSFTTIIAKYPINKFHSDSTELLNKFFDGMISNTVNRAQGKLLSRNSIKFKGYPGVEFYCEFFNSGISHNKTIIIENRQYSIMVFSAKGQENNKESENFFNSLEINGLK